MQIDSILSVLENFAPPSLQESYDNAGLLTGDRNAECAGVLCCLDATEKVIDEAISMKCNLVVAHHPIIFSGLKQITGSTYIERTIIKALKNDVAIYAIHTNLDNVIDGVNRRIADKLGLKEVKVLAPAKAGLNKLVVFIPKNSIEKVRQAMFDAGAGGIGDYSECSFLVEGEGTFKPGPGTDPFVGEQGKRHTEPEARVEVIFPSYLKSRLLKAMIAAHPYEEPAYDIIELKNTFQSVGAGMIGNLPEPMPPEAFLRMLTRQFNSQVVRYTRFPGTYISKVALCGGAGSFLITNALHSEADAFVTADIKYHQFFDSEGKLMICDIGHFESEQYTIDLLHEVLVEKFPTFAVLKTTVNTNPVKYFVG